MRQSPGTLLPPVISPLPPLLCWCCWSRKEVLLLVLLVPVRQGVWQQLPLLLAGPLLPSLRALVCLHLAVVNASVSGGLPRWLRGYVFLGHLGDLHSFGEV